MRDITYNRLIMLMKNQYYIMISNNTWKAKSFEQEQIVVKGNLKLSKPLLDKVKSVAGNAGHEGKRREERQRNNKKKFNKRNQKKDEMWKKKEPRPNGSKIKEI